MLQRKSHIRKVTSGKSHQEEVVGLKSSVCAYTRLGVRRGPGAGEGTWDLAAVMATRGPPRHNRLLKPTV